MLNDDGFITLREFAKRHGFASSTALCAAKQGRLQGAELRQYGGYTIWYVPENSNWEPKPMGRQVGTRFPKRSK